MGFAAAIVFLAQLISPQASKADETAIREVLTRYANAYNNRRLEELAELYRADAQLMPPYTSPIKGRNAIETYWRRHFRFYRGDAVRFDPDEINASGDVAYVAGQLQRPLRNFVLCLERDSQGVWRIAAEIWNEGRPGYQPLPGRS